MAVFSWSDYHFGAVDHKTLRVANQSLGGSMNCYAIKKRLAACAASSLAATLIMAAVGTQVSSAEPALFTGKGAGQGAGTRVIGRYLSNIDSPFLDFEAYGAAADKGVRLSMSDITNDNIADLIVSPGGSSNVDPRVKIFDGKFLKAGQTVLRAAGDVYGSVFEGAVSTATADLNGDGYAELIVAPGRGGRNPSSDESPPIKIYDGKGIGLSGIFTLTRSFFPWGEKFIGGSTVTACDVDGNGIKDIVVGVFATAQSKVRVFRGDTLGMINEFIAFPDVVVDGGPFLGGVNVACGDTTGDGKDEIVVAARGGWQPRVRIFERGEKDFSLKSEFNAYPTFWNTGSNIAVFDMNNDGHADIITGPGQDKQPIVNIFDGNNNAVILASYYAYASTMLKGVHVAAGSLEVECADGLDNDGDSLVDGSDPGCSSPSDNDESNLLPPTVTPTSTRTPIPTTECSDGIDNDGDGLIDMADPGCFERLDNDERNGTVPPPTATFTPTRTPTAVVPSPTPVPLTPTNTPVPPTPTTNSGGNGNPTATATPSPTATSAPSGAGLPPTATIPPECVNKTAVTIVGKHDDLSIGIARKAEAAAKELLRVARLTKGNLAQAERDVKRTRKESAAILAEALSITLNFGTVSRELCPNLTQVPYCHEEDNTAKIKRLEVLDRRATSLAVRTRNRTGYRSGLGTRAYKAEIAVVRSDLKKALGLLEELPGRSISCG